MPYLDPNKDQNTPIFTPAEIDALPERDWRDKAQRFLVFGFGKDDAIVQRDSAGRAYFVGESRDGVWRKDRAI